MEKLQEANQDQHPEMPEARRQQIAVQAGR